MKILARPSLGLLRKPEECGAGGVNVSVSGAIQMKGSSFRKSRCSS